MSEYKLKPGKVGKTVMGAYKKVEDAFVDAFLEKVEPAEDTTEPEATDAESAGKPDQA